MNKLVKALFLIAIISILLCCNIVFAYEDSAQNEHNVGDLIGHIYETDIVSDIDGMKIPSYNIGGETVIIAEDLTDYGFDVSWDQQTRTVSVYIKEKPDITPVCNQQKGKTNGKIIGNVYYTDIKAIVNGFYVKAYNIGGKTALSIEELSCANKPEGIEYRITFEIPYSIWGYSSYMFKSSWNQQKRTISLFCLRPKMEIKCDIGNLEIDSFDYITFRQEGLYFLKDSEQQIFSINDTLYDSLSSISYQNESSSSEKTLIENGIYYNLTNIISAFGLNYTFENNTLNITGSMDYTKKYETKFAYGSNHSRYQGLPIVKINILRNGESVTISDNECFVYYGNVYIKADLFAKIIKMQYINNQQSNEFKSITN
jgi:hypothetical protein